MILARRLCLDGGALPGFGGPRHTAVHPVLGCLELPRSAESVVVVEALENGNHLLHDLRHVVRRPGSGAVKFEELQLDEHPRPDVLVGTRQRAGIREAVRGEIGEQPRALRFRNRRQARRALEEADRRREIAPAQRRGGCALEALGGAPPERVRGWARIPELDAVAVRLLEVVPGEGVETLGTLLEPVGVALVEECPRLLRDRVVRCVAEQEVAEAEGVLPLQRRLVGTDEVLADE
jgi:hypothetical protein